MSRIHIGRVFLTPDQRRVLDQRRRVEGTMQAPASASASQATDTSVAAKDEPSASGYIIIGSGEPKQWRDGEFIDAGQRTDLEKMRFPGDVRIVRHAVAPALADEDDKKGPQEAEDEQ